MSIQTNSIDGLSVDHGVDGGGDSSSANGRVNNSDSVISSASDVTMSVVLDSESNHRYSVPNNSVIIADIGGYSIKYGWCENDSPKTMGNCVCKAKSERRRLFIGDQLDECKDCSGLFYILPFNKGYLMNMDIERQIFDHMLKKNLEATGLKDKTFLFTEPYFNFRQIQENMLEVFFEEYQFGRLAKSNPAYLSMINHTKDSYHRQCCLVVDSGYSFTHIVPFINGKIVKGAICRIDMGGKALTNHLKDIISYRQLHVLDETYVINQCKEDCCYVSTQFNTDLMKTRDKKNPIVQDYVLPDFTTIKRGYVRQEKNDNPDLQSIRMNNERFQVPEILFYPSDVGINQIGISHSIIYSIESCPEEYRPFLYENILLVGGNSNFSGYRERILQDVRSMADSLYDINVISAKNPIIDPWYGGKYLVSSLTDLFSEMCHTKKEYEEIGAQNFLAKMELLMFPLENKSTEMEVDES